MHLSRRLPWFTLAIAAVSVGIHCIPGAPEILQFDRTAVENGDVWRWLTAHVTHFDANHLSWDGAALVLLGWSIERKSPSRFALALGLAALLITPAVWLFQPHFETYRGLSGLDSAAFGVLATSLLLRSEVAARATGAIALAGIFAKFVFELATQHTLFAAGDGYAPVPLAHVVGLLSGVVAAIYPAHWLSVARLCEPLRRLVDKSGLFEGRRRQPPARLGPVDAAERAAD